MAGSAAHSFMWRASLTVCHPKKLKIHACQCGAAPSEPVSTFKSAGPNAMQAPKYVSCCICQLQWWAHADQLRAEFGITLWIIPDPAPGGHKSRTQLQCHAVLSFTSGKSELCRMRPRSCIRLLHTVTQKPAVSSSRHVTHPFCQVPNLIQPTPRPTQHEHIRSTDEGCVSVCCLKDVASTCRSWHAPAIVPAGESKTWRVQAIIAGGSGESLRHCGICGWGLL